MRKRETTEKAGQHVVSTISILVSARMLHKIYSCICEYDSGNCDSVSSWVPAKSVVSATVKRKRKKLYLHHSVEPANTHVHVHVSELVVAAQKVNPSWVHDLESKQQSYNLHLVSTSINKISVENVLDVPGVIVCVSQNEGDCTH
jgi:hypothetical protein